MVDHHDIYALDAAALHRLRDDVATLSNAELGLPTRCDGWTVDDLIQHMNAEHEAILKPFSDQGHARRRHLYELPVSW